MSKPIDNNTCRVCMQLRKGVQLFDPAADYDRKYMAFRGDGLPDRVCIQCVARLQVAYDFLMQAKSSEKHLRQCIVEVKDTYKNGVNKLEQIIWTIPNTMTTGKETQEYLSPYYEVETLLSPSDNEEEHVTQDDLDPEDQTEWLKKESYDIDEEPIRKDAQAHEDDPLTEDFHWDDPNDLNLTSPLPRICSYIKATKEFVCDQCEIKFRSHTLFMQHMNVHAGLDEFRSDKIAVDSLLIQVVHSLPAIWNKTTYEYKNIIQKDTFWQMVGALMNKPVIYCKKRWRGIRDTFAFHFKTLQKTGQTSCKWRHYQSLMFLAPIVLSSTRQPLTRSGASPVINPKKIAITHPPAREKPQGFIQEATNRWLHQRLEDNEERSRPDPFPRVTDLPPRWSANQLFYASIAARAEKLHKRDQSQLQMEVLQLINEKEHDDNASYEDPLLNVQ